ncbi:MAG TPA: universal stress protein [Gaiellaceae bacterium]|jgi:APA family basic amino acid/polyamine antiporter|nr:universal stress protein [Gaiellaceae bacterium]
MARKLPGLKRELDARALYSVAYGEIASSIYFALGVLAAYALGFTPLVLLVVGALFLIVSTSYAEGTAALPETGGAATFVRRASNDLAGFLTGWALFLDYLIVIALSALFLPRYLAGALQIETLNHGPWDEVFAVCVIALVAAVRLFRRPSLYGAGIVVPILDLLTQLLLVVLGFAFLFSPHALAHGTSLGSNPSWHDLAFALPLAMLAFTGLETVANLAEEARRPGVDIPRSLFGAIATVVTVYVAIAVVAVSAFPGPDTELGHRWIRAPLLGIADHLRHDLPWGLGHVLRFYVGATGALILLVAITTSISGFSRLAYSMGEHGQLPRGFGRMSRRAHVSPHAILSATLVSSAIVVVTSAVKRDVTFLASVFSFGVLLAFTAAQVAVIRLRIVEPDLPRPYRAPFDVRIRGKEVPLPAIVGSVATFAIWIVAMATHPGARYAGPVWLAGGVVLYVAVRASRGEGLLERVEAPDEHPVASSAQYHRILVPMKLGIIGEEMIATAVKLASEHDAEVHALHVIRVPLEQPLDAPMLDEEERAEASLAEAKLLGSDFGVEVKGSTVRARAIGHAIVSEAERLDIDLIVLGSSPRWRRQSRFFSPTVDYVLRRAPCEVLIVAFPQSVMDEELAAT